MKRQIRKNVFETNSSSCHSLVIKKMNEYYTTEEIMDGCYLRDDGTWHMYDGCLEFGRSPFRCISGFTDKLYYMMAALASYNDDTYNELERICKKYMLGFTKFVMPMTHESKPVAGSSDSDYVKEYGKTEDELAEYLMDLEEKYGDIEINYWTNSDETYWYYELPYTGYAEDYGMLKKFLDEKELSIEEFLINKKYVIIQDGDEYCYYDELKNSGLFNMDAVDYEYPEKHDYE